MIQVYDERVEAKIGRKKNDFYQSSSQKGQQL